MAEDRKRVEEWAKAHPEVLKGGTVENTVAQNVHSLAYSKGLDVGSDEYMALLDEHLGGGGASTESAPSVEKVQRRERKPSNDGQIKLSPQEQEVARACGIDLETYASSKAEMIRYKRMGLYGRDEVA